MYSNLTLSFLQNIQGDRVNVDKMISTARSTHGKAFEFIKILLTYNFIKLDGQDIIILDKGEKFSAFKRDYIKVINKMRPFELALHCSKMTADQFLLLNYIYNNPGVTEKQISSFFNNMQNVFAQLSHLKSIKFIELVVNEYYCALESNDYQTIEKKMAERGVTLDMQAQGKEDDVLFTFGDFSLEATVDLSTSPNAVLSNLYLNCGDLAVKRKLMLKNFNLFANFKSAINMERSYVHYLPDDRSEGISLNFDIAVDKQIGDIVENARENGIRLKFDVCIVLKRANK